MLSVNFDMCFHFIDQWMRAFIVSGIYASSLVFVSVMFSSLIISLFTVKNEITKILWYCWLH